MLGHPVLELVKELTAAGQAEVPLIQLDRNRTVELLVLMLPSTKCGSISSWTAYHQVLDVVWTHPFPSRQSGEGGVQAVHVEQKGTIVTLDEWSQPTASARDRNQTGKRVKHIGRITSTRMIFPPVACKANFYWQWNQTVGVQFVLGPPEGLPQQLFFSSPFAAACRPKQGHNYSCDNIQQFTPFTLNVCKFQLTWQSCRAGQLAGQLELGWVSLHGSCYQQLKWPLEEARRGGGQRGSLQLCALNFIFWLRRFFLPIILLLRRGRRGRRVGGRRPRSAARPTAGPALQKAHLSHPQTRPCCSSPGRQPVETQRTGVELQLHGRRHRTLGGALG